MTGRSVALGAVLPALLVAATSQPMRSRTARVVDAVTSQPIANAIVTIGARAIRSDTAGLVHLPDPPPDVVHARALGYVRARTPGKTLRDRPEIRLTPLRVKGLYLSVYGIGDRTLRTAALALIDTTELNALVIDVKGDRGIIPYRSALALAERVGAQKVITIKDLPGLIAGLHERGIYTIARIVVFKDHLLGTGRADLAVRRRDGTFYRDREQLAWTDPYNREVWAYNIGVAIEAAQAGFDEIQFDYVRLPDATGLAFPVPQTERNREAPVEGFLTEARKALVPYNVFVAADIFGYVCWNPDDTRIGQRLEHMADIVDYVSPMLYPSSFQHGIPGYRNPVEHPYEIVRLSLKRAVERTQPPPARFRPWLQAFRDYAFGGRPFGGVEIRNQIKAADDAATSGWMLWNSRNRYAAAGVVE